MSPIDTLNESLAAALSAGVAVSGWHLQADGEGYAAWLYWLDGDTERCLFDGSVEMHQDVEAAAAWCLEQARGLVAS